MRKKILNHTCILVVVSVLLTFLAAGLVMYGKYNEDLKESVRDSLKYVQDGVEKMGNSYLDDALGKATSARITLLDPKGNVLFDSLENSAELENHSNRPELIQAEKNGYAESLRYSETLSKQNFYCAVKLADGDILRVGRTTDSVFYTMLSSSVLLGGLLILIFAVELKVLPSSGAYTIGKENDLGDRILHLILPMTVVVLGHLWYYAYLIRNKLLEEVRADYVLLAKSKGVTGKSVMFRHCVRNIIPTYLSIMAISVPHILGGTYIIEMVFSYPGIGTLSYESARYQDYNLLMVICLLSGALVILCNMIAQTINERIDPRMKGPDLTENVEVIMR